MQGNCIREVCHASTQVMASFSLNTISKIPNVVRLCYEYKSYEVWLILTNHVGQLRVILIPKFTM